MCVSPRSGGADCTLSEGGPVAGPCRRVLVGCWLIHHAAVRLAVAAHHVGGMNDSREAVAPRRCPLVSDVLLPAYSIHIGDADPNLDAYHSPCCNEWIALFTWIEINKLLDD